ncbi:hypothetical protein CORC01_07188 [Colletotrichum orchidophilum]|uniref:Nephrocystin 3-like N-terminal domain-containing protein n=1 Tax=Colletotrichum orchidophilum TaxID=1209926 RepID=A0A1G4B8D0_9PEZI|nr:uncharacterized protein CORC01_07188 [Colletotrichum orchidophilum]OHE97573.1 hypothetical protein CORC01_07188 [Colletotrichum orchidophilum]
MDYERCRDRRHPDTCRWLLKKKVYKDWASPEKPNSILWLTAAGGRGKSVLTSFVIDHLSERQKRPATPYVMITYAKERNRHQLFSLLALQLLEHVVEHEGGVEAEALSLLSLSAVTGDGMQRLIRLMVSQCSEVYFFVDGLNEIQPDDTAESDRGKYEKQRLRDDLRDTLTCIANLVRDNSDTCVRLWCSSQHSSELNGWMQGMEAQELIVDEQLVRLDILEYLTCIGDVLSKFSSEDIPTKAKVLIMMIIESETNFRWANLMLENLKRCRTAEDLDIAVDMGLPKSLRHLYLARLSDMHAMDVNDSEEFRALPLSKNLLSLITLARRPLRLSEVREALSIIAFKPSSIGCRDLNQGSLIQAEGLLDRCSPLIDFIPTSQNPEDGYFRLSHGSVFEFLKPREKNHQEELPIVVDHNVIANACLRYMFQHRYAKPLKKISNTQFCTNAEGPSEDVLKHSFLKYAAKYWYRHLEVIGRERCTEVKAFVLSPQFLTTIQVQSLFVVGHFINTLNEKNALQHRLLKQNLPEWFRKCSEVVPIVRNYEHFLKEWSDFLRLGITTFMNGEIDRVFWGALGPNNFLSKHGVGIQRNKSYLLETSHASHQNSHESAIEDMQSQYLFSIVSADGKRLSLWKIPLKSCCDQSEKLRKTTLVRELWYIDGDRPPFQYAVAETLSFDPQLVGWNSDGKFWTSNFVDQMESSRHVWEDIVTDGEYIVRSCRKSTRPRERESRAKGKTRAVSDGNSSSESEVSEDSWNSDAESGLSIFNDDLPSAEEYHDGSDSSSGDSESDDSGEQSDSSLQRFNDGNLAKGEYASSTASPSSSSSSASKRESIHSDIVSGSEHGSEHGSESLFSRSFATSPIGSPGDGDEYAGQPRINTVGSGGIHIICDLCDKSITVGQEIFSRDFFQCIDGCNETNEKTSTYDICQRCYVRGGWCLQRTHVLRKMRNKNTRHGRIRNVPLEIISYECARPVVTISVHRVDLDTSGLVFRYTNPSSAMLYSSPPVLHPAAPLMVYALDGQKFIFANLEENTYFIHENHRL